MGHPFDMFRLKIVEADSIEGLEKAMNALRESEYHPDCETMASWRVVSPINHAKVAQWIHGEDYGTNLGYRDKFFVVMERRP